MKKTLTMMTILIIVLGVISCGKDYAGIIVGEWEGEGEVTAHNGTPENIGFTVTFSEDGKCSITPEGQETAEGPYSITKEGKITATVKVPGAADEVFFEGSIEPDTEIITLSATITPSEEEYERIKAYYESLQHSHEMSGEEFTVKIPTVEELSAKMTMSLSKIVKD